MTDLLDRIPDDLDDQVEDFVDAELGGDASVAEIVRIVLPKLGFAIVPADALREAHARIAELEAHVRVPPGSIVIPGPESGGRGRRWSNGRR